MMDSGHTPEWTGAVVERVMSNGKRVFALAFRSWLVEQARQPGASVAGLALRHGINANQLRRWIVVEHKLRGGLERAALLPVTLASRPMPHVPVGSAASAPAFTESHIELEVFGARIKLHGEVDGQRLRTVLDALAARNA